MVNAALGITTLPWWKTGKCLYKKYIQNGERFLKVIPIPRFNTHP